MFARRRHPSDGGRARVSAPPGLQSSHVGISHFASEEVVFAVILFDSTPSRLPRQVEDRCKDVVDAEAFGFSCNYPRDLREEGGVEGGRKPDWGGERGTVVGEAVHS